MSRAWQMSDRLFQPFSKNSVEGGDNRSAPTVIRMMRVTRISICVTLSGGRAVVSRFGGCSRSWTTGVLAGVSVFALVQAGPVIARDGTSAARDLVALDSAIEIAQSEPTYLFDIASKPLPEAMIDFSAVTGLEVLYTEPAPFGQTAPALQETLTAGQALERLTAGSGLVHRFTNDTTVTLESRDMAQAVTDQDAPFLLNPIFVEADTVRRQIGAPSPTLPGGQLGESVRLGPLGNVDVFTSPFSVTSYDSSLLRDRDITEPGAIEKFDASIRNFDAKSAGGNIATSTFSIRGFNGSGQFSLFNGFPLNGRVDPLAQIERIEVFKGPSILIGNNLFAVGGVLNFVPKRAPNEGIREAGLRFESPERIGTFFDYGERFGARNEFGLRVNGFLQDGETAIDDISPRNETLALAADYAGDRLRASLDLDYNIEDSNFNPRLVLGNATALPDVPDADTFFGQTWAKNRRQFLRGLGELEFDILENWTIAGAIGYNRENFDSNGASTGSFLNNDGDFESSSESFAFFEDNFLANSELQGEFQTGAIDHAISFSYQYLNTTSGFEGEEGPTFQNNIFNPVAEPDPGLNIPSGRPNKDSDTKIHSFSVINRSSMLEDRLSLVIGARFTDFEQDSIDPDTGDVTSNYSDSAISPVIGAVWDIVPFVSLYANYMEGFEPGFIVPSNNANAGEQIPPGEAEQYEFGVKYEGGNFGVTFAYFNIERPLVIEEQETNIFSLSGAQVNKGLEVNLFGEFYESVRFIASASYIDSELSGTDGGTNDGNSASGVPEFAASLNIEGDIQAVPGLSLYAGVNYTGETFINIENDVEAPSYTTLDIGASYDLDMPNGQRLTVRAAVDNVTDEDYFVTSVFGPFSVGSPRTFTISGSYRF